MQGWNNSWQGNHFAVFGGGEGSIKREHSRRGAFARGDARQLFFFYSVFRCARNPFPTVLWLPKCRLQRRQVPVLEEPGSFRRQGVLPEPRALLSANCHRLLQRRLVWMVLVALVLGKSRQMPRVDQGSYLWCPSEVYLSQRILRDGHYGLLVLLSDLATLQPKDFKNQPRPDANL